MKGRAILAGGLTALVPCLLAIALTGCRSEPERPAMAQVVDGRDIGASRAVVAGRADAPTVTTRRLWAGGYADFYASSISPDGRYLSMVDWSTTDLAVRDLQTQDLHRLTNVERGEGKPYEDAGVSVFSRDGRKLVVGWQYFPDLQLRLANFQTDAAGVPRAVEPTLMFHNPEYYPYYPLDWSPDDADVLAKVYILAANTNQLALISVEDGTYRPLKSFDWREPLMAKFSPDGRYVAYDFQPDVDSPDRDVFVVSLDGTYEAQIVDGPAIDRLLGWHPDGDILFHSDRSGTPGVWRMPMSDGRPAGPPQLLKADIWGVEPLGFAGRSFYYGVKVNPSRLHTATVDLEAGRLIGPPEPAADPARVNVRGWDWSPDGDFLAYSAGIPGAGFFTQRSLIGIRAASGQEVRTISVDLAPTRRVRWDPDRRSLLVFSRDSKARRGFYRIDLESGTHRTILHTGQMEASTPRGNFAVSPDGTTLYYARGNDSLQSSGRLELVAHDLESGEDRHVAFVGTKGSGAVALSPDGSRLAVVSSGAWGSRGAVISTVPVSGGPFTELQAIPEDVLVFQVDWTPDGRALVYTTARPQGDGQYRAWIVDAEGGEARRLELGDGLGDLVRIHPDGRRVAFKSGESRGEVWVMEGLGRDGTEVWR